MAFQPVPDGVEVVLTGVQNGVPVVNVFNVLDTTTHDETRLGEIADVFKDWFDDFLAPVLHESYTLETIKATNIESSAGPQVIRTYTTGNVGLQTGAPSAGNGAAVISWRTALIGRSFRGRTYVGALSANITQDAQNLYPTAQASLVNAGTNLIDLLDGIGVKLAVLSRFAAGVLRVTGLLTEIIGVIVDQKIDSQRRRTAN